MILRYSGSLGKKLHFMPKQVLPVDANPFADWSAHLFRAERVQYILITNTVSLYSMVMAGRGIADGSDFLRALIPYMREFLGDDGFEAIYEERIAPGMGEIYESKALNRSVTGSMNDLVKEAKIQLGELCVPPWETSFRLNEVPMGALKYRSPRQAFEAMQK